MTGYQHGADYYITKPCTAKQLLYGIGLVLGRVEAEAGAARERRSRGVTQLWMSSAANTVRRTRARRRSAIEPLRAPAKLGTSTAPAADPSAGAADMSRVAAPGVSDRLRRHRGRRQVDADARAAAALRAEGHRVEVTAEPGGTALGRSCASCCCTPARPRQCRWRSCFSISPTAPSTSPQVIAPALGGRRGRADRSLLRVDDRLPGVRSRPRSRRRDPRRCLGARRRRARS